MPWFAILDTFVPFSSGKIDSSEYHLEAACVMAPGSVSDYESKK